MNKAFKLILLFTILMFSCTSPSYLPQAEDVQNSTYGSYIELYCSRNYIVEGELIAAEDTFVYVLSSVYGADSVKKDDIYDFTLTYAKEKRYRWVFALAGGSVAFGFGAVFAVPLGLLTGIFTNVSGKKDFQYTIKNLPLERISDFARFPAGLPPGVKMKDLSPPPSK